MGYDGKSFALVFIIMAVFVLPSLALLAGERTEIPSVRSNGTCSIT